MYTCNFVLLTVITAILYLYWYLKKKYSFFDQHRIPYIKPNFIFGNLKDVILLRKSMAEVFAELHTKLKPHKIAGIYAATKPLVMIRDPELLKDVLIKDFAYFNDRGFDIDRNFEPLMNNLFFMKGDDWEPLRMKLTSSFTSGKIKMMFPLVQACGEKLQQQINKIPYYEPFDVKDLAARYTTDIIGSCIFGLDTSSLENPNSEFRMMGKGILRTRLWSTLRWLQLNIPKKVAKLLNMSVVDMNIQNYFAEIIYKTIAHREKNNVVRNDLLDLLIKLKNDNESFDKSNNTDDNEDMRKLLDQVDGIKESKADLKITNEVLASQALLFFVAGFETSSTNLCYLLLELSLNKHIQEKVRREIHEVISANEGKLDYNILNKMTYTDMVIKESLRKYPPLSILFRKTIKNYKVPDSDVIIPADTRVIISLYGLQWDEKYYDNPEEFRPERFTQEEIAKRPNYTYLPFGDGPRYCIGMRFARMFVKLGLVHAIKDFSFEVSPNMKFPIKIDRNFGMLAPNSDILLYKKKNK